MKAELELLDEQILTLVTKYVQEDYPELTDKNFGTTQSEPTDAVFPFIYVGCINAPEISKDLENDKVNGGLFTYQIKVISNDSKTEVKNLSLAVSRAMKRLGFSGTSLPLFEDTNNLHVKTARWQRALDEGDTLE